VSNKPTCDELLKKIEELEQKNRDFSVVEKALNYRISLETLIMDISARFIRLPAHKLDKGITRAIQTIGNFLDVDRVYIFKYRSANSTLENTHEWCGESIESHISRMNNIPLERVSWLVDQINAGKDVYIPRVEDLPDEAAIVREELRRQAIQSLLAVPMVFGGNITGFLGVDSVRQTRIWTNDVISLLRITGEILANAMERKHSEEAVRESEEKYRVMLEAIEDGYWEVDLTGRFTFANSAMCRIADRTLDELIGSYARTDADKKTGKRMAEIFTRIFETGQGEKMADFELVTPKGARKVVEMSVSLARDSLGNPAGFRGVSRDITEKVLAGKALRESEERYRTVLESNPDPVVVTNSESQVVYLNPAFEWVFGWTLAEQKEKILKGFIPKDKMEEYQNHLNKIQNGESFSGLETIRSTRCGKRIPVSISAAPYKDIHGHFLGGIVTLQDIRERKRMEAQLMNAQKFEAIGTLAGGIAHDFNNLLMGIQGNISIALFDMEPDHPLYEIFQNIEKNVKRGSRLTGQLLGYARKGKYEVKPLDLNRLIEDISETFARARKDIVLTRSLSQDLPLVEADEGQMEQVLLNLLVNAGQAMVKGGDIRIATRKTAHEGIDDTTFKVKPGDYVMIQVADTGVGMEEETLKHLFEPFFTTKEMGLGTGLGLASVYGIIKGHSGYVTVESKPGKGSSFQVYLPVSERKMAKPGPRQVEKSPAEKETILFIDDEAIVLDVGCKIIERLGYRVIKAGNPREAINVYERHAREIHLVILDIIMPGMSGGEVFDEIRKINPTAKILLSSGYSIEGEARSLLERGCNGFIQKPFSMKELSEKIVQILL
jgi:PAS domain S-box-containing protein